MSEQKGKRETSVSSFMGKLPALQESKTVVERAFPLVDFAMGGTAAAISKTFAAPIERVKLLMQNQGAMLAAGRLDRPYTGIGDCFKRTFAEEGLVSCACSCTFLFIRSQR